MGFFRFLKNLFGQKDVVEENVQCATPEVNEPLPEERLVPCEPEVEIPLEEVQKPVELQKPVLEEVDPTKDGWKGRLILSSNDLIQMARKLQCKGELYRAEQLLRDGVKNALDNLEYWWLLVEIEEPLNRKGRLYYCLEQILRLDGENEHALEKKQELQKVIDTDLACFIEYKLAPEFYRLKN